MLFPGRDYGPWHYYGPAYSLRDDWMHRDPPTSPSEELEPVPFAVVCACWVIGILMLVLIALGFLYL